MSTITTSEAPTVKSVTIIRQDVIAAAGQAALVAARQARFLASVALLLSPTGSGDKWRADASERQSHTFEFVPTEHPVESGSIITDHVRRLPELLSFQGWITDTPYWPFVPIQASRALKEFDKLLAFGQERLPVFVATSLRVYESMLIRRIMVDRDASTGGAIPVQVDLQEIRIASLPVNVPLISDSAQEAGGLPTISGGNLS